MAPDSHRSIVRRALEGGDRRSVGAADEVARDACEDPALVSALVDLLEDEDDVVAMRAADALEKATRDRPELLVPVVRELLAVVATAHQQELRWHLAQLLPRMALDRRHTERAFDQVEAWLEDRSAIVRADSLTCLVALAHAREDDELLARAASHVADHVDCDSAAVRARCRRLLGQLARRDEIR